MKKIALLFTILCAGPLNGMALPKPDELNPALSGKLPEDVKPIIIMALSQSGDNLNSAIRTIKKASLNNKTLQRIINEKWAGLKGFTTLVHKLANKFNTSTQEVAQKFKTPAAKQYLNLSNKLILAINYDVPINQIKQLINQGADVNYTFDTAFYNTGATPLTRAVVYNGIPTIKLLLNSGANPNLKDSFGKSAFEWVQKFITDEETKQLLDQAMRK